MADCALIIKEERIVLVVDKDFDDIPSWVEWDATQNKLSIAQMGGAVADINALVPVKDQERFKNLNRVLLIARHNGRRVVHFLSFIMRD